MIPGPFSYHRPASVADAVKLLSTLGDEARPLAGGHSLVPMMKLRLATPGASGRPAWHRRPQGHQPRRRQNRDRGDDHAA